MKQRVQNEQDTNEYVAPTSDQRRFKLLLDPIQRGEVKHLTDSVNLAAGLVIIPPAQEQPSAATHPRTEEVLFVLSGRGSVEIAGERFSIGPGSLFHIPAETSHRLFNAHPAEELRIFWANTPPLETSEYKPIFENWSIITPVGTRKASDG